MAFYKVLCKKLSKRVVDECELLFQDQPVKWSSLFKYVSSPISGTKGISFLEDSVLANVTKICGSLLSACNSAVGIPVS